MARTLTVILAGGKGTRLDPLTRDRAKPAVPFGGVYRIIDFTLSNCINSGLRRVLILTQFKSQSLEAHARRAWNFLPRELGESVEVFSPQQRVDENWYRGTADALYQNIYSMEQIPSDDVLVLAGDHVYKMDYTKMLDAHRRAKAAATIGVVPVPMAEVSQVGVIEADADDRVTAFREKPKTAKPMPDDPNSVLGSMGIYAFPTKTLYELLCEDAADEKSQHDFGKDVIPRMIAAGERVHAHRFQDAAGKSAYWRDVGTIDAYFEAHMDLVAETPTLDLYDREWPLRTDQPQLPPAKFVHGDPGQSGTARRGEAHDCLVSAGCVISGGTVRNSVLSPNVRVNSYAVVEKAVLMEGVDVGRHCLIKRAIIDKGVRLPPRTVLGHDLAHDRRRGFVVSDGGVVVVAKGEVVEAFGAG